MTKITELPRGARIKIDDKRYVIHATYDDYVYVARLTAANDDVTWTWKITKAPGDQEFEIDESRCPYCKRR